MHHNQGFDWDQDDFNEFDMMTSVGPQQHNYDIMSQSHGATTASSTGDKKKISDAQIYGPRFCAIYEQYRQRQATPIDIRRHLMSLCVDHMISFINWARESDQQVSMISSILLENDYLRPEVRNGVVMVLIYTFASMKATTIENMDMFTTLQDPETGLGIANKFSLKIYNDPFNYLIFLKLTISALIDAGVIPDNERLSQQPKKGTAGPSMMSSNTSVTTNAAGKVNYTNHEEYESFQAIATRLVTMLDAGKNTEARNFVSQITNFWQMRGKYVRNRKFACALQALASSDIPLEMNLIGQESLLCSIPSVVHATIPVSSTPAVSNTKSNTKSSKRTSQEMQKEDSQEDVTATQPNKKLAKAESIPAALNPIPPLHILRFERIGHEQWDIQESRIFDLSSFLSMLQASTQQSAAIGNVYLVNEVMLSPALLSKQWIHADAGGNAEGNQGHGGGRGINLAQEIKDSIITSWLQPTEYLQLSSFLSTYAQHSATSSSPSSSTFSLFDLWTGGNGSSGAMVNSNGAMKVQGYLAYEIESYIIFIIRKNPSLGISEDIWCRIYPMEINSPFQQAVDSNKEMSIGEYLLHFFPQLQQLKKRLKILSKKLQAANGDDGIEYDENDIMLKYYQHKVSTNTASADATTGESADSAGETKLPAMLSLASYQTVGTYTSAAKKIISR
jgi:hypothetical protein